MTYVNLPKATTKKLHNTSYLMIPVPVPGGKYTNALYVGFEMARAILEHIEDIKAFSAQEFKFNKKQLKEGIEGRKDNAGQR